MPTVFQNRRSWASAPGDIKAIRCQISLEITVWQICSLRAVGLGSSERCFPRSGVIRGGVTVEAALKLAIDGRARNLEATVGRATAVVRSREVTDRRDISRYTLRLC
jgi:hypothetical protein